MRQVTSYYNPEWGSFINADSLCGQVGTLLSHNIFAYCENNPVNKEDPSGYWGIRSRISRLYDKVLYAYIYIAANIYVSIQKIYDGISGHGGKIIKNVKNYVNKSPNKGGSNNAYNIAKKGGKHSGFYSQYVNKATEQIQKGIKSIQNGIIEHEDKILNPQKYIDNFFKLDPRQQDALINKKWPSDIQRQTEQLNILRGILNERGIK